MSRYKNVYISKTTLRIGIINIPLESRCNQLFVSNKLTTMEATYDDMCPVDFSEQEKRSAVIMALVNTSGKASNRAIADMLGIDIRTIQRLRKRLEEEKDPRAIIQRMPKALEDRRKSRDGNFIALVEEKIQTDPGTSIRAIARELNVDKKTVQRCVEEDLRCKSYRLQTGQLLTQATKDRRLAKSVKLLNKLKHPKAPNMMWFFSDEKNFCQDQAFNRQNNRWIAMSSKDVPKIMKTKFPATVMVFGAISSEGDVMPPHIFETGLRVNTDIYLDVLSTVVFPWIKEIAGDRPWVWQQDSAPCHVSGKALGWLKENCFDFVHKDTWPPSSPDLNPMDYFFWGVLEARTNRRPHTTKASLITAIKEQSNAMERELVQRACSCFRTRVEQVIEAEGSYIE